jgi:hypothetical protein
MIQFFRHFGLSTTCIASLISDQTFVGKQYILYRENIVLTIYFKNYGTYIHLHALVCSLYATKYREEHF